ncbi:TetR family transcriptional regulator [Rhodococcus sp. BP-252]|uniref:TetR family transcriptional regulator n=1 Tax=Rhodococcoides kyotonense TaxID=398843 RepID=A0A177YJ55_9NOCA|nr:TetR family transcriptional regulator [Rhodococcus sp. BP-320]MBY6415424.1 TetR family transcriptional regulator [Rhodococcus sp. BP-321]MBY6420039.1 TetR family transcriptional regulator [Rhodococcus sp. BP-324]MBY6425307.1 TetR family transcriptional regulator [Rhodococcus sp. BP-323]MBY6430630.1 TetR family transcriptional regulator [Rhodococcus sp. BP-322]MBY6439492.1 TetR family transcriptional regulator [Rhodococcus sp. BP-319]MBY6444467.1 TetR family transcriptional regulator [Rhodo
MECVTNHPPGLRDQKKAATRDALGLAALNLAKVRGLDAVTADAIAAEAGVSTRTFHNYFANKEEAVLHHVEASALEWFEMLRARPSDEPLWDSLRHVGVAMVTDPDKDLAETFAVAQLIESNPSVMARKLEVHRSLTRVLGEAIAERTGTDVDHDLYPNLVQMSVGGAVAAALTIWTNDPTGALSPQQLVEDAFDQLQAGLPDPREPKTN